MFVNLGFQHGKWSCTTRLLCALSILGLSGQARRAPMVEQAVQTMPLVSAAQKKGKTTTQPQNKPLVRPVQRSGQAGAQIQKENIPTSKWTLTVNIYFNIS